MDVCAALLLRTFNGRMPAIGADDSEGDETAPSGYDASDGERLGICRPSSTSFELKDPAWRRARAARVRLLVEFEPAAPVEGGEGDLSEPKLPLARVALNLVALLSNRKGRNGSPAEREA